MLARRCGATVRPRLALVGSAGDSARALHSVVGRSDGGGTRGRSTARACPLWWLGPGTIARHALELALCRWRLFAPPRRRRLAPSALLARQILRYRLAACLASGPTTATAAARGGRRWRRRRARRLAIGRRDEGRRRVLVEARRDWQPQVGHEVVLDGQPR